jgi:diguanylate cyclase
MIFTEDASQAALYLRKAVPKMIEHNIVPNPFNYTLWYSYYSNRFPQLNSELDYVVDRFGTCPTNMSESLFLKHIIKIDKDSLNRQQKYQQAIAALVGSLSKNIENSSLKTKSFAKDLQENIVFLESIELPDELKKAVGQLSANAVSLCDVSMNFESEISAAKSEISQLKEELEKSQKLALTDSLTGLSNRRVFEACYNEEMSNEDAPKASLIMMDIDNFKVFNDTHGHVMGDQVLKVVGKLLADECQDPLLAVRFGGEEFVMYCPGMLADQAFKLAEKVRKKLSSIALSNKRTGQKISTVTASFGVAQVQVNDLLVDLVGKADKALYKAKSLGRNQVQIFS